MEELNPAQLNCIIVGTNAIISYLGANVIKKNEKIGAAMLFLPVIAIGIEALINSPLALPSLGAFTVGLLGGFALGPKEAIDNFYDNTHPNEKSPKIPPH